MRYGNLLFALSVACLAGRAFAASDDYDPNAVLTVLPGFKIEHLLTADRVKNGSWICMAKDSKGRLLLGAEKGQPVTRVTLKDGKVESQENLQLPLSFTMGLLCVGDTLYVTGQGKDKEGRGVYGFFKCTYSPGSDRYEGVEFIREWRGGGEHGAHGIVLGPDRHLYCVNGNFTTLPADLLPSSPHRNYADDLVLKRAEDGNGFGAGVKPPGGQIIRMDLDGKNAELFAAGLRNTYDIAFNPDGELFGFDADMEWEWGTPWYRPVRVFQAVSGGDTGFREGSGKWPEYYPDSLPATVNIGLGSPTGVVFGTGAKYPAKYQKAFFICDWTYGRVIAVHLKPNGAGYTGTYENFVATKGLLGQGRKMPMPLTDLLIGDDGAMYFTVGGWANQAHLYRVTYTGNESTAPLSAAELHDKDGEDARALRHKIEAYHAKEDRSAVAEVWPHLNSADRYIRYAARIAIERNPVAQWRAKALAEKAPNAALTALLALARLGTKEDQADLVNALAKFPLEQLDAEQRLSKVRVLQVSVARHGKPAPESVKRIVDELNPLYPSHDTFLDRELCQLLLALDAPDAVAKSVKLLVSAQTQEEQVGYAAYLRTIKSGWTIDLRKQYFGWFNGGRSTTHPPQVLQWFAEAGRPYADGLSFPNFLGNFHEEAKFLISPDDAVALSAVFDAYQPPNARKPKSYPPRKLVKDWTTADLMPILEQASHGRNFERGKNIFDEAQCSACHRFGDRGGAIAPDLTTASSKYRRSEILESITEPSKVIFEAYLDTIVQTKDGKVIVGRVLEDTAEHFVVRVNPLNPEKITIQKADVKATALSKISPMPTSLLNNFTKEEILDLLAYLESQGNKEHPNFAK